MAMLALEAMALDASCHTGARQASSWVGDESRSSCPTGSQKQIHRILRPGIHVGVLHAVHTHERNSQDATLETSEGAHSAEPVGAFAQTLTPASRCLVYALALPHKQAHDNHSSEKGNSTICVFC